MTSFAAIVPPVGTSVDDSMTHPLSPISRATPLDTMFCNDTDEADTAGVQEILHFDSGHSAFASRPADLADLLLRFTEG